MKTMFVLLLLSTLSHAQGLHLKGNEIYSRYEGDKEAHAQFVIAAGIDMKSIQYQEQQQQCAQQGCCVPRRNVHKHFEYGEIFSSKKVLSDGAFISKRTNLKGLVLDSDLYNFLRNLPADSKISLSCSHYVESTYWMSNGPSSGTWSMNETCLKKCTDNLLRNCERYCQQFHSTSSCSGPEIGPEINDYCSLKVIK